MNCPTCQTKMKELSFSLYCPNDCDLKPTAEDEMRRIAGEIARLGTPAVRLENDPGDEDVVFPIGFDDEPTQPYAMAGRCPSCRSTDIEAFDAGITDHCWECGHVWRIS